MIDGVRTVVRVMPDRDAAALKTMAAAAVQAGSAVLGLLTSTVPAQVVVARSSDVAALNASAIVRELVGRFGGKVPGDESPVLGSHEHVQVVQPRIVRKSRKDFHDHPERIRLGRAGAR